MRNHSAKPRVVTHCANALTLMEVLAVFATVLLFGIAILLALNLKARGPDAAVTDRIAVDGAVQSGDVDSRLGRLDDLIVQPSNAETIRKRLPVDAIRFGFIWNPEHISELFRGDYSALRTIVEAQVLELSEDEQAARLFDLLQGPLPSGEVVEHVHKAVLALTGDSFRIAQDKLRHSAVARQLATQVAKKNSAMNKFLRVADEYPYLYMLLDAAVLIGGQMLDHMPAALERHWAKQADADTARPFDPSSLLPGTVYRAIDGIPAITIISSNELEFIENHSEERFVCDYADEFGLLRVILQAFGAKKAVYYAVTPDGLLAENGMVLYHPKRYEQVMREVEAARRQRAASER